MSSHTVRARGLAALPVTHLLAPPAVISGPVTRPPFALLMPPAPAERLPRRLSPRRLPLSRRVQLRLRQAAGGAL